MDRWLNYFFGLTTTFLWITSRVRGQEQSLITISTFIPTALDTVSNVSQQCLDDSLLYVEAFTANKKWALSMYESSGKLPETNHEHLLLRTQADNTRYELGLFDQCLSVQAEGGSFNGQYCSAFFETAPILSDDEIDDEGILKEPKLKRVTPPKHYFDSLPSKDGLVSFCLPSTCTASDLGSALGQWVGRTPIGPGNNMSIVTITDDRYCFTREKIDAQSVPDRPTIAVMSVLGVLILLVILGTVHELWTGTDRPAGSKIVQALQCFSAIKNGRRLLSVGPISAGDISCLHGIRVLTTFWVILIHMSEETFTRHTYNRDMIIRDASKWQVQIPGNGTVTVDTFLLMSSLLVTCSLLRDLDKNKGRFNAFMFYFHRYMRLTPLYAVILGFIATLWFRLGSGPDWTYIQNISEACRERWWTHLLYINNFDLYNPAYNCMAETWYLACEMQMFWISPLIIYPLWKWRRAGMAWALALLATFVGVNIAVHLAWDLPPTIMGTRKSMMIRLFDYLSTYYVQSHLRLTPYILGILLGYALHRTKRQGVHMNKFVVGLGWTMASVISMIVVSGLIPYLDERTTPVIDKWFAVSYGSLHRIAWAGSVAWVIFACVNGYGGWINGLLSWKPFIILGRLTYVVYLTHYNYIRTANSYTRKPLYYSFFQQGIFYWGIAFVAFMFAVAIAVVVEIPFLNLEKLLTSPSQKEALKKKSPVTRLEDVSKVIANSTRF